MKNLQQSKNAGYNKASIDLPVQKIWTELEKCVVESSLEGNQPMDKIKTKRIENLMDKAFELVLDKMIRQN